MARKLTWADHEGIAARLCERFPALDPLTVRFTDLRAWVCQLEDFGDDPSTCSEQRLEAIQMAWLDERSSA